MTSSLTPDPFILFRSYCSGLCKKDPDLRWIPVLRTRDRLKFGSFQLTAESF